MSKLDSYLFSKFGESLFFSDTMHRLHSGVKGQMVKLSEWGIFGAVTARVISPIVGGATLVASLALRVCSIVEPIIGILADVAAAVIFRSTRPLFGALLKCTRIPKYLWYNSTGIFKDLFKIGLVAALGGIIAPGAAYKNLSNE